MTVHARSSSLRVHAKMQRAWQWLQARMNTIDMNDPIACVDLIIDFGLEFGVSWDLDDPVLPKEIRETFLKHRADTVDMMHKLNESERLRTNDFLVRMIARAHERGSTRLVSLIKPVMDALRRSSEIN